MEDLLKNLHIAPINTQLYRTLTYVNIKIPKSEHFRIENKFAVQEVLAIKKIYCILENQIIHFIQNNVETNLK